MLHLKPFRGPHQVKRSCFGHKIKIRQCGYSYRYSSVMRRYDNAFTWFYWPKTSFVDLPITFRSLIKQKFNRLKCLPALWLVAVPGSWLGHRAGYHTIFLFLEQIAPSWRHISARIHAHVGGSRVDVVTLPNKMVRVGRFFCRFFTATAGNKERNKGRNKIHRSYM